MACSTDEVQMKFDTFLNKRIKDNKTHRIKGNKSGLTEDTNWENSFILILAIVQTAIGKYAIQK